MPAKAGIQNYFKTLDSRLRGNDAKGRFKTFYETIKFNSLIERYSVKWYWVLGISFACVKFFISSLRELYKEVENDGYYVSANDIYLWRIFSGPVLVLPGRIPVHPAKGRAARDY
jgi:hypothetical protein